MLDPLDQTLAERARALNRGRSRRKVPVVERGPLLHHRPGHFNVELQAQHVAQREGLMGSVLAAQEVLGARRKGEGLAVPVEHLEPFRQPREPRV